MGGIEGVTNTLGAKLPGGVASQLFNVPSRVQGVVTGIGLNAGLGMAGREATGKVLENAGYTKEAEGYKWNDPTGLALDVGMGAVFGGLHQHIINHPDATTAHTDAALTINDANALQHPEGIEPTSIEAANELHKGMTSAVHALANDEPVTSAITTERFTAPEDLIALAGNKMSREDRQNLEQQRSDLEYKVKQLDEGDYTDLAREKIAERQAEIDANRDMTRIPARRLAAERKANEADSLILAEGLKAQDAQPHHDSLARINDVLTQDDTFRKAEADISRLENEHLANQGYAKTQAPTIDLSEHPLELPIERTIKAIEQDKTEPLPINEGDTPEVNQAREILQRKVKPIKEPVPPKAFEETHIEIDNGRGGKGTKPASEVLSHVRDKIKAYEAFIKCVRG